MHTLTSDDLPVHGTAYPFLNTLFVCLPPPIYACMLHGIRTLHHLYATCMLTAPPILYQILCVFVHPHFIYACILTAVAHLTISIPPACSRHSVSFVPSSICTSFAHLYAACMITTPPIICSIFCLSNPFSYAPACSRPLPTSPPLCRLHAHDTALPLPLQHRPRIRSTLTHHSTTPRYYTNLPPSRHSTASITVVPTSPITTLTSSSFVDDTPPPLTAFY